MNKAKITRVAAIACVALFGAMAPRAVADAWNQRTTVTFSGPVEIPGQVLQPGTYVFRLMDSVNNRNIVEVYNRDESHLYGMFLAIPDYHLKPADKPIITFEERAVGSPEAVRAWFYPGDMFGHEFVYPKVKAMALAKANNMPVASMPNELSSNTTQPAKTMQEPHVMAMKNAPLKAEKPSGEEEDAAQAFTRPPAGTYSADSAMNHAAAAAPAPVQTAANTMPKELPQTASPLPLIGLAGILLLGTAALLRRAAGKAE